MCRLRSGEPSLAEYALDFLNRPMSLGFRLAVGGFLGGADRASGRHEPLYELGSLYFIETGVRPAPKPAANNEVATVRRHRMLHSLGRLPLRLGRRLLRHGLLRRLLASDRHQHFLLTGCRLAGFLRRLRRSLALGRSAAADTFAQRVHKVDHVFAAGTLLRGDGFAGALLVDEIDKGGFVLVFELVRLE